MGVQHIPTGMGSNDDGGSTGGWNLDDENCLSYFLGGETVDNGNSPNSTNSATQITKQRVEDSSLGTLNHNQIEVPSTPAVQFYTSESLSQKPHRSKSSPTLNSSNLMHGSTHQQVPLQNGIKHGSQPNFSPFTNYQSHASTTALRSNVGSSSSSSSLSSMQATSSHQSRAHQAHQQYQSTSTHLNLIKKSPTSSTTPCSVGEEVMMLPPPPRLAMNNNSTTCQQRSNPTQPFQRQQISHLEWLQHMNQAAVSLLPFSSHNSMQNNILTSPSSHVTQHNQDSCTKQPQFPAPLPSVSRPSPTMNNISPPKQHETVTPKIPIQGTMQHANILPSLPSNGNVTQQLQFFPQSKEVKINASAIVETKERRQRRLARNRESARQSRRRKKQLLNDLGLHVNKLQAQIESERQKQLIIMEKELNQDRERLIKELVNENFDREENVLKRRIQSLIQDGGPNSSSRRNAIVFQYDSLREIILPHHKQFLLWLSLKNESFFISAKEKRSKTGKGTGRVSSKYVGDELSNAHKCAARINAGGSSKSGINCSADDAQRVWPLFCYELGVSLDQEEKLLNAFRRVKEDVKIRNTRRRLSIATTMASKLRDGVSYQSHSATERNAHALIEVLTPSQAARFQEWVIANKSRCNTLFDVCKYNVRLKTSNGFFTCDTSIDLSMSSVCQQLTEALKINEKGVKSEF